jgi:hypothetical protein
MSSPLPSASASEEDGMDLKTSQQKKKKNEKRRALAPSTDHTLTIVNTERNATTTTINSNSNKHQRCGDKHSIEQYQPGSIVKVSLRNFMTYQQVELVPGPDLNVLIGPNGTGKSSFVCAICLGLNGPSNLLGNEISISFLVSYTFCSFCSFIRLFVVNLLIRSMYRQSEGTRRVREERRTKGCNRDYFEIVQR